MSLNRTQKTLIAGGLALLLIVSAVSIQVAAARRPGAAAPQVSPLHPAFALLDQSGANVLQDGSPVSTMQTCGQCHDTAYIASHSFHTDLGQSQQTAPGSLAGGQPWDTSPGLYGRWDALTYRYLSPEGDSLTDLTTADWLTYNASRIVGGGPAAAAGVEMNCFLCHLPHPNNTARVSAIQSGNGGWAPTATLLGSGLVETANGTTYTWNKAAFSPEGELVPPFITIQDPSNSNCAQCHGLVHDDAETPVVLTGCALDNRQSATTGQIISGQKISISGMNIADKASLARSWDIHAERGISCTDCHYSLNNPAYYQSGPENRPSHLEFDPRRLEIGEFLQKPDHNLARGQSARLIHGVAPAGELNGTMRRCESCHNADTHATWLPYPERHLAELACETCHIPQVYAPALQAVDWTVIQPDGQPLSDCRGVAGEGAAPGSAITDLVTGFQPVLLPRQDGDGALRLAPYNLVSTWYWVSETANGPRPVRLEDLQTAWLSGGGYDPQVLQALDADQNGQLSQSELRLDTPEKTAVLAGRLQALGLQNPHIEASVQPYSINHDVTRGEWATSDCQACHADNSRLAAALPLAASLPGGVIPHFTNTANAQPAGQPEMQAGALVYRPDTARQGLYVFGHNRIAWVDWFGGLFFVAVLAGVAGHGGVRFYQALRHPKPAAGQKKVYMYAVYERFWHWLQTFTIVFLLLTGLIIHRPDVFGWLSFPYMVAVHNILAAILVINAGLSLFYHLASGEIRQFIPRPYGFFDQAILQAKFYLQGIFRGDPHPFEKTPGQKMNPLQQVTYFGILNVLLPLQIITGALMWGVQRWPGLANLPGGLPFLAPFHSLVAWTFAAFIVGHVYLTTTGHAPLAGIQAMMLGWENVEAHDASTEAAD